MKVKVKKARIQGEITIPPSKSYAHRILLCCALGKEKSLVKNLVLNKDISATIEVLERLGAKIEKVDGNTYSVTPINRSEIKGKSVSLYAYESGSTLRFILPILCALGVVCTLDGDEGLRKRPIKLLLDVLREHGANIDGDSLPIKISGEIKAGRYEISATQSSQNLTGLMYALSLLDSSSEIVLVDKMVSRGYVDITIDVLKNYGVNVLPTPNGFLVSGEEFLSRTSEVEGDWSSASFIIALGVLCGQTKIRGLREDSLQGDRLIFSVLKEMGADVGFADGVLVSKKSKLKAIKLVASDTPDMIPIFSVCTAFCEGESEIFGVDRLKIKESDRLKAIEDILDCFGVSWRYEKNTLFIKGGVKQKNGEIKGYNDHRIVMSGAVMALGCGGECVISDAQAISKSYPSFFEHLRVLGGESVVELL